MTAAGFDALCKAKRTTGKENGGEDGGVVKACNAMADAARKKMNVCSTCRGKKRPAELEIIKMEVFTMATKRGICDSCGEKGLMVSPNHGVNMCSTCKTIHSHVKNRSETVVGAVKRMELVDRYVGDLAGDLVQTTVESLTMERIAAAVGYDGKDGDELIAAVEAMAKSRLSVIKAQLRDAALLEEISEIMGSGPADPEAGFVDLVKDVGELVEAHMAQLETASTQPSMDVIRALGLPEGQTSWQTIELAAMQTAAMLDDAVAGGGQCRQVAEMFRLRALVGMPDAPLGQVVDQVEHLIAALDASSYVDADLVTANNRVDELETTLNQIGAAIGKPDLLGEDLVDYCAGLAFCAQPVPMDLRTSGRPAESYILDLALMALRGEVTGLDPDFIGAMREAV